MDLIDSVVRNVKSSYDDLRKFNKRQAVSQGVNLGELHAKSMHSHTVGQDSPVVTPLQA